MSEMGIQEITLHWFRSYLTGRKQQILIKGEHSEAKELSCGVPQGSNLGPTLFNIYTSSLGHLLSDQSPQYQIYADDTSLYACVRLPLDPGTGVISRRIEKA